MDFESAIYCLDHGFAVKRSNWNKFLKVKYNKLYWALPDNDTLILSNCIMWQDFYLMMTRDSLYKDWQLFDPNKMVGKTAIINLIHPEPRFEPDGYDQ